jgi:hypothetical protein
MLGRPRFLGNSCRGVVAGRRPARMSAAARIAAGDNAPCKDFATARLCARLPLRRPAVAGELAIHLVYNSKLSGPPDVTPRAIVARLLALGRVAGQSLRQRHFTKQTRGGTQLSPRPHPEVLRLPVFSRRAK